LFALRLSQATYTVVSRKGVTDVNEIAPYTVSDDAERPDLPDLNQEIIKTRVERASARAQAEVEGDNWNERATMRDQQIFSELSKTMTCKWMNPNEGGAPSILVMEAVIIQPPFGPDTTKGKASEKQLETRVKKVLGGIIEKVDAMGDRLR